MADNATQVTLTATLQDELSAKYERMVDGVERGAVEVDAASKRASSATLGLSAAFDKLSNTPGPRRAVADVQSLSKALAESNAKHQQAVAGLAALDRANDPYIRDLIESRAAALKAADAEEKLRAAIERRAHEVAAIPRQQPAQVQAAGGVGQFLPGIGQAALGFAGVATAAQALSTLVDTLKNVSREALVSERAEARLTAALDIQGRASQSNVRALQDQANAIERLTGVDDKAIQQAQLLAVTLGGKTVQETMRATQAAVNLAAALDGDVSSAMLAIVKASENGGAALSRLGIRFDATGDPMQDFLNILELLEKKLGKDFAEKSVGPVEKKINELRAAIEDNDKALGESVVTWETFWLSIRKGAGEALVAVQEFNKVQGQAQLPPSPAGGGEQALFNREQGIADAISEQRSLEAAASELRVASTNLIRFASGQTGTPADRFFPQTLPYQGMMARTAPALPPPYIPSTATMDGGIPTIDYGNSEALPTALQQFLNHEKELEEALKDSAAEMKRRAVELGKYREFDYGNAVPSGVKSDLEMFLEEDKKQGYQEFDYGNAVRIPSTDYEIWEADQKRIAQAEEEARKKSIRLTREWGDFFVSSLEETFRRTGGGLSIFESLMLKLIDELINAAAKGSGGGGGGAFGVISGIVGAIAGGFGGGDGGTPIGDEGLPITSRVGGYEPVTTAMISYPESSRLPYTPALAPRQEYAEARSSRMNPSADWSRRSVRPIAPIMAVTPFNSGAYGPNYNPFVIVMDDAAVNQIGPQLAQLRQREAM